MTIRRSFSQRLANVLICAFITFFTIFCLLPFLLVLMVSFTDETAIMLNGYSLFPEKFSIESYAFLFRDGSTIWNAYAVTIFVTLFGGFISVIVTSMFAYVLSNKKVKYRNILSFYMYFTMLFGGGLVPWYLVCVRLGLRNNIMALILPMSVSAWNTFLIRNFFSSIPESIAESARIDGANEFIIFVRLILPLAMPGVATISMFYMLGYWNDWWHAIIFIDKPELYPLQYFLRKVMSDIATSLPGGIQLSSLMNLPTEGVRMATTILTIGPIIFVYPFAQRYFIKGITIGAVKG